MMDLLFWLLANSHTILIVTGILLWFWPRLQRLLLPKFKSGIRWEQIIWGYRPGVLRQVLAVMCVCLGLLIRFSPTRTGDIYSPVEPEIQWMWLAGILFLVIVVSVQWFASRSGSQTETDSQQVSYWKRLTPAKRRAWIVFVVLGSLIGWLSWWYVRSIARTMPL